MSTLSNGKFLKFVKWSATECEVYEFNEFTFTFECLNINYYKSIYIKFYWGIRNKKTKDIYAQAAKKYSHLLTFIISLIPFVKHLYVIYATPNWIITTMLKMSKDPRSFTEGNYRQFNLPLINNLA